MAEGAKGMITEDQLRQIEERCNSASEGPWAKKHGLGEVWMEDCGDDDCGDDDCALAFMDRGKNEYEENADFIAHARTDVPALIAEVRRLRKLFDDAGDGAYDVLALVEHYQAEVRRLKAELDLSRNEPPGPNARMEATLLYGPKDTALTPTDPARRYDEAHTQPAQFPNGNRQFVRVQFPSSTVAARDYCNAVANELLTHLPSTLVDLSYTSWSRNVAPGPAIMTVQLHFNMPMERVRFLLKLFAAAARLTGKVKASLIPFEQGPGGQGESFSL